MANFSAKSISLNNFINAIADAKSQAARLFAAGSFGGDPKGISISPRKEDIFIMAPGVEPILTTVRSAALLTGTTPASDAFWALPGTLRRKEAEFEYLLPIAALRRLGKEFPGLGDDFTLETGETVPNRSGWEFIQDLLDKYPNSKSLYLKQSDFERASALYGEGEGFTLTFKEEREGYTLPFKSKGDRDTLLKAGHPWGSNPKDWRRISMLFVSIERNKVPDEQESQQEPAPAPAPAAPAAPADTQQA